MGDNFSDFCDTDLSRQLEAMVADVETAYANRPTVKNSKALQKSYSTNHLVSSRSSRSSMSLTSMTQSTVKPFTLTRPTKNILREKMNGAVSKPLPVQTSLLNMMKHANVMQKNNPFQKITKDAKNLRGDDHFQLLRRTLQLSHKQSDVPKMTACNSLASAFSDVSMFSRTSSEFLRSTVKKTRNAPSRPNAEWAIIE